MPRVKETIRRFKGQIGEGLREIFLVSDGGYWGMEGRYIPAASVKEMRKLCCRTMVILLYREGDCVKEMRKLCCRTMVILLYREELLMYITKFDGNLGFEFFRMDGIGKMKERKDGCMCMCV
ncbi:hypothetical protein SUGI_0086870 [Cryptomeria japonica]|nr:hypothetical protein SUGI_0086870 [Cryptomeria japonica]